mmetsp:Transcript_25093/g.73666  ORF Transcript_25093/g.73666 Transcript_25093/m.73666 type:complete len:310 (-) Transcript_25093:9-938(-)
MAPPGEEGVPGHTHLDDTRPGRRDSPAAPASRARRGRADAPLQGGARRFAVADLPLRQLCARHCAHGLQVRREVRPRFRSGGQGRGRATGRRHIGSGGLRGCALRALAHRRGPRHPDHRAPRRRRVHVQPCWPGHRPGPRGPARHEGQRLGAAQLQKCAVRQRGVRLHLLPGQPLCHGQAQGDDSRQKSSVPCRLLQTPAGHGQGEGRGRRGDTGPAHHRRQRAAERYRQRRAAALGLLPPRRVLARPRAVAAWRAGFTSAGMVVGRSYGIRECDRSSSFVIRPIIGCPMNFYTQSLTCQSTRQNHELL